MTTNNSIDRYLIAFETEEQISDEIFEMEKLRAILSIELTTIDNLKYYYQDEYDDVYKKDLTKKYEISPKMFEKGGLFYGYNNTETCEDYKKFLIEPYRLIFDRLKLINVDFDEAKKYFKNVKENICKIAYHRIKLEKDLIERLAKNNLDIENYEKAIEEICNRIEKLYEKACYIITSSGIKENKKV